MSQSTERFLHELQGPSLEFQLQQRINEMEFELETVRKYQQRREEAAYENGLGSAAEVHRQNKILTQMIQALIDPGHRLNLQRSEQRKGES